MRPGIAPLLASLLAGCASLGSAANGPLPSGPAVIYVVERGWHTDVGLPTDEVRGPLATLGQDFPGVRFMVFGFGERVYYMSRHAGSGDTLTALLPSPSAILMTALSAPPPEAFPGHTVVRLRLSQAGVDRIGDAIWESFEKTPSGGAVHLGPGPYLGSMFYASRETYDAFHTCNTWTAALLRRGGIPTDPAGVLFADQVMQQVSLIAARQSAQ